MRFICSLHEMIEEECAKFIYSDCIISINKNKLSIFSAKIFIYEGIIPKRNITLGFSVQSSGFQCNSNSD